MRVCFIEDTDIFSRTRLWVLDAAEFFLASGIEVVVLTPERGWIAQQCATLNVTLVTYDHRATVIGGASWRRKWTEALRGCDIAVCTVHPPRGDFHCAVFAARCIREAGLETHLITKTGTTVPGYLRGYYLPEDAVSSSVVTITEFTRRHLIVDDDIPPERIRRIYQGTDTERFRNSDATRQEALRRYPLPQRSWPVLGCLSSYEPRKGHGVLLEALRSVVDRSFPDAHLMMVGDGPEVARVRRSVDSLGLREHVSFFDFTTEPNIAFERVDVTMLPSLHKEGLPNVVLESMSMARPVIASRLAGVPEVVEDGRTGYLVEPGDASGIADAVVNLFSDREAYSEMAGNARRLVTSRFDVRALLGVFLQHFMSICHVSSVGPSCDRTTTSPD